MKNFKNYLQLFVQKSIEKAEKANKFRFLVFLDILNVNFAICTATNMKTNNEMLTNLEKSDGIKRIQEKKKKQQIKNK